MKRWAAYGILFVAIICLWQYFGTVNSTVKILVSSPSLCIDYFRFNRNQLLNAALFTAVESLAGLLVATLIAFLLMIICFRFTAFFRFILPLILSSQVIPLITFAPFFILWLGIGISSKVALAAVISFFPIFMNFSTGYNSIPVNVFDLLDIYKAKLSFRVFKVYFPLSLPNIFTGLKISSTLSVIGAIVAEFTGAEIGLGKNLLMSAIRIEPELMMLSIFLSGLVGGLLFGLIYTLEKIFGKWYLIN